MRSFGANNIALLGALAAASLSSTVNAQQCQASATQCVSNTDNMIMTCSGGSWVTNQCGASSTCMTMGAMTHCMLDADGDNADSSSATPTSTSSMQSMETTSPESTKADTSSSSGAKGFGREAGAFIAVGAMIAGMVALF
ncbi:hypothetical protein IW140_004377 [Coemansia sp. RSA 1813]|nr:hypothetical protein EV178_004447 [Coemansia sp. RSA 1646]KAJ1768365.1 hypothetical protein LPJ74_004893 [Coemansia sp. RSA 1843]KAJ2087900.1 hypothetical protein IW138_004598 [Coemansia sp. RSA 986]KAJ2212904.1 hypothetical protein EV179_004305 [Coemansia sp. RSA 487]KAJ2567674.1 hypothetical protein IW140_004377 [Coemansia sp. RSA 1813]